MIVTSPPFTVASGKMLFIYIVPKTLIWNSLQECDNEAVKLD